MTDLDILKKIEEKIDIKFSLYEEWKQKRDTKEKKVEKGNRMPEMLEKQQLYSINAEGHVIALYLNGLGLTQIPNEVYDLHYLKRLDLVRNKLTEIPLELLKLEKLVELFIFSNEINNIPDEVLFTKNLRLLHIYKNPIKNIPPEILNKREIEHIRDYVLSLKGKTKNLNEVKVILVGDGGAGKTSLQKLLIDEIFDPQESQTHGINIKHLKLKVKNRNVNYRLWDFGGQEIMHATHQFFLSQRSIYIILLNAREEPNPEYWLNHVKSFGGSSPVIIVINKIDENPSYDVNRLFLKEKYPNIITFIKTSCVNECGIEDVKKSLMDAVVDIQDLNVKWALSWFSVKKYVENMKKSFINYDEFTQLCLNNKILDSSSQNTLVEYLNDLGIILHFKDFSLADTHVLDPEWVTYAVYKIINSKLLSDNNGIIKLQEIRKILNISEENNRFQYPSSQLHYIIELMMKFELCYKISNTEILIPDLLAVQEPPLNIFSEKEKVEIVISYDFLPKSILPRLIVNLHADIKEQLRWRTGLVVYDKNLDTIALIKADYEQEEINITIEGDKRRDYLSIILHIIRKVNHSFKGLNIKVNIPIPEKKSVRISHSHLLLLESKGIKKYIPDGLDYEVEVQGLLGSIQTANTKEDEILNILEKFVSRDETKETILEKANEIILLQPNLFGFGLNLNAIVRKFQKKK